MEIYWFDIQLKRKTKFKEYLLVGDIGGTNTSFALAAAAAEKFHILGKFLYKTKAISSIIQAIKEATNEISRMLPEIEISKCCISAAGPVAENRCTMTNVSGIIDGDEISAAIKIPVKIINDFTAINYALPLLELKNTEEVIPLPDRKSTRLNSSH